MLEIIKSPKVKPYIINCHYVDLENCGMFSQPGPRRTKWYELELILRGGGYMIIDGKKYYPRKGNLYFRSPGTYTHGFPPYSCYLIDFDMSWDVADISIYGDSVRMPGGIGINTLDNAAVDSAGGRDELPFMLPPVFSTNQYEKIIDYFKQIYNEIVMSGGARNKTYLSDCMVHLLGAIIKEWQPVSRIYGSKRSVRLNYPRVMKVKKYIDNNIFKKIKLRELAEIADLSPGFLDRIFKEIMGETPVTYINKTRIEAVKKMLLETDKSVKEIAYDCGFENDVYFYMLFKKIEGVSPLTFKDSNTF